MKLRRLVDDFRVDEWNLLPVGARGDFAVYELAKTGWTTLDALDHFSRTLNIPRRQMTHAGLKDRHAVTRQVITIRNGPRRTFGEDNLSLRYLGQSPRATGSGDIAGNRFEIVLRGLTPEERQQAEERIPQLQSGGIPNYFDDQRFGSWFPEHGLIGAAWVRENYELALWLTFAEHQPEDQPAERAQKAILREHWKDWLTCKQLLDRSHRRSIVTFLCDKPEDFKGAWAIVNADLRGLYLSALQSSLWNDLAAAFIRQECPPEHCRTVMLKAGGVVFPAQLTPTQRDLLKTTQLPLPSARIKLAEEPEAAFMEETLRASGWTFSELKVRFPRDRFFSRARRAVLIALDDLSADFADDELEIGRWKGTLRFSLPRGSYATMVVKSLWSTVAGMELEAGEEDAAGED